MYVKKETVYVFESVKAVWSVTDNVLTMDESRRVARYCQNYTLNQSNTCLFVEYNVILALQWTGNGEQFGVLEKGFFLTALETDLLFGQRRK